MSTIIIKILISIFGVLVFILIPGFSLKETFIKKPLLTSIAVIFGLVFSYMSLESIFSSKNDDIYTKSKAKIIVEEYLSKKTDSIDYVKWLDTNNDSNIDSLFVAYTLGKNNSTSDENKRFSDLLKIGSKGTKRLYHNFFYERNELEKVLVGEYESEKYMLIYSIQGSGQILRGSLYKIDELNQLIKVFSLDNEELLSANAYVSQDKIVIISENISYTIDSDNGVFSLKKYKSKVKYPDLGYSKHFLRVISCKEGIFSFDNKIINSLNHNEESDSGFPKFSISILENEEIVIPKDELAYRVMIDPFFEVTEGVIFALKTTKKGSGSISFKCDLGIGMFPEIQVLVN